MQGLSYRSLLVAILTVMVGCAQQGGNGERAADGFYSYVDAQGNLVTIAREEDPQAAPASSPADAASVPAAEPLPATEATTTAAVPSEKILRPATPDELWNQPDDGYLSADQLEAQLLARDRDRFVSYLDEQGRVMTYSVDMVEAHEQALEKRKQRLEPGEPLPQTLPVGVRTGTATLPVNCCAALLDNAVLLDAEDERRVRFSVASQVDIGMRHPARAFRLAPGISHLEVESWNMGGYQWPGLLLLDAAGRPLVMVDNLFTRAMPETWSSEASVRGVIDVEPRSVWVVLFLNYAEVVGKGFKLNRDSERLGDQEYRLAVGADTVIRGLSAGR